jgi:hypothetical protein
MLFSECGETPDFFRWQIQMQKKSRIRVDSAPWNAARSGFERTPPASTEAVVKGRKHG